MKQGRADSSGPGAQKVEPKAHPIDVGAVSRMGQSPNREPHIEMPTSPSQTGCGCTVHKTGSQGKH